ncbi:MAG: single-stranded DNA-binding protein [Fimbriimonadaceae bacterium]|jgi:single-strand DNA-binding protein|nr:single-stranded DNA-binding protein [Fimbriimonadaceae bacterium]
MSINRVVLVGRLTRDPEVRETTTGKKVATFAIAVDKRIKPTDGPTADFFNITAWGVTADYVGNYMSKGRLVAVDGRLQTRKYTTQDGQNREVVEIVADNVQGLDRARDDQGGRAMSSEVSGRMGGGAPAPSDDYDPFADE